MKAALLLVPALLLAQDKADAPPPAKGTISGAVYVAGTNTPMKDVEVYANRGNPQGGSAITDALGHYVIKDVTPGQVRISAVGADTFGRRGGFGPTSQRQINLAPGQDLANIDFHLLVHGRITGHVVDQNKEPVVGVTVYLVVREYSHGKLRAFFAGAGNTDDEGNYLLDRILPGRAYAVLVQKRNRISGPLSDAPLDPALRLPAFVPTYYPNAAAIDGAEMITLKPGEVRDGVDIRVLRSPSFCLDATVVGASGQLPFSIAETQPSSGQSGNGGFYTSMPSGQSGKDGKIRVCDLHPGEYELSVHTFGTGSFAATTGFASSIITIGDRDVAGVQLAIRPKLPVSGEVVFDGPAPQTTDTPKVTLFVQAITRTERGNTAADVPGTFTFEGGLAADDYGLDIQRRPPGTYVKDIEYGGHSILYAPIPVGKATGDGGLRIILGQDGGSINARVTNKDGSPVADCSVALIPAAASSEAILAASMSSGRTDQNGSWQSGIIAPGKYYAVATNDTIDKSPEAIGTLWKARTSATEVELTAHGKASVSLVH